VCREDLAYFAKRNTPPRTDVVDVARVQAAQFVRRYGQGACHVVDKEKVSDLRPQGEVRGLSLGQALDDIGDKALTTFAGAIDTEQAQDRAADVELARE
jgi:hypothetical protein